MATEHPRARQAIPAAAVGLVGGFVRPSTSRWGWRWARAAWSERRLDYSALRMLWNVRKERTATAPRA